MNYMKLCIVESILGILASWSVLYDDEYLMISGLTSNILLIIQIFDDDGSLVSKPLISKSSTT